jgi:beta-galactosidase beta subunit
MISGHIGQLQDLLPMVPAPLRLALQHLRDTDFTALPAGNYDLQGKDLYVQVIDMNTAGRRLPPGSAPPVRRRAVPGHRPRADRRRRHTGKHKVGEDMLSARDLLFYADVQDEATLTMRPGSFAVFMPSDVHRPGGAIDGPEPIRKVVLKVRVALLQ